MTEPVQASKPLPIYRLLGSSAMRVHPITLGTMNWGNLDRLKNFGLNCSIEAASDMFSAYIEAGGNSVDTANLYNGGESEVYVGTVAQKFNSKISRDELIVATKYSTLFGKTPNLGGNHKKNMMQSLTKSLERLKMSYIDLFYVHVWDHSVDMKSLIRSLDEVVRSGKVLHIAISDTPAWQVAKGNTIAELMGFEPFTAYQGKYSLLERSMEAEVYPCCKQYNIGTFSWGTLGQGKLSGKHTRETQQQQIQSKDTTRKLFAPITEQEFKVIDACIDIGKKVNLSPAQVSTAWALQRTTSVILGASSVQQVQEAMQASTVKLTSEHMTALDEASKPLYVKPFPHEMIGDSYKTNTWTTGGGFLGPKTFNLE